MTPMVGCLLSTKDTKLDKMGTGHLAPSKATHKSISGFPNNTVGPFFGTWSGSGVEVSEDHPHVTDEGNIGELPSLASNDPYRGKVFLVVEPSKILFLVSNTISPKEDIILLYIGYHSIPK